MFPFISGSNYPKIKNENGESIMSDCFLDATGFLVFLASQLSTLVTKFTLSIVEKLPISRGVTRKSKKSRVLRPGFWRFKN